MIGAEFISSNGRVPVIITGHKSRQLVEVYAVKYQPFTEYSAGGQPGTHSVKCGYVRRCELINLRSTRIMKLDELSSVIHENNIAKAEKGNIKWEINHPRIG